MNRRWFVVALALLTMVGEVTFFSQNHQPDTKVPPYLVDLWVTKPEESFVFQRSYDPLHEMAEILLLVEASKRSWVGIAFSTPPDEAMVADRAGLYSEKDGVEILKVTVDFLSAVREYNSVLVCIDNEAKRSGAEVYVSNVTWNFPEHADNNRRVPRGRVRVGIQFNHPLSLRRRDPCLASHGADTNTVNPGEAKTQPGNRRLGRLTDKPRVDRGV